MRILFLDLASHSDTLSLGASIACCDDQKILAMQFVDHRMGDDQLMPTIESVMKEAGWKYEDLTNIAVVNGPGGFTSLRMAVTLGNILADQLGVPAVGIHMSDVYNARTKKQETNNKKQEEKPTADSFLWIHSTKKTELFIRGFGSFATLWPEPILLSIDDFVEKVPSGAMWAGELIADHRAALADKNLRLADLMSLDDVLPTFLAAQSYSKELILPWYGRGY